MGLNINGSTRLLGLVGHPLAHSMSPKIHNHAIQVLGLNQVYVPMDLKLKQLKDAEEFLSWAWSLGVVGLNVTLPYKEMLAQAISSPLSSINTIYRAQDKDKWAGASTDGIGFQRALERLHYSGQFEQLVLLGNGGAALALAGYVLDNNVCQKCRVLRRSREKDQHWIASLASDRISFHDFQPKEMIAALAEGSSTLLVQASSAPLLGDDLKSFAEVLEPFAGVFIDIVYGRPSSILQKAADLGIPCQDGLPMLIEQARESQKLWWGQTVSYEMLDKLLR